MGRYKSVYLMVRSQLLIKLLQRSHAMYSYMWGTNVMAADLEPFWGNVRFQKHIHL